MKIKCLALWQPWATLVIEGLKKIETRPQYSAHRGITGIHATKDSPPYTKDLFYTEPFMSLLRKAGYADWWDLPRGGILGTVQIKDWLKVVKRDPIHPRVEMNAPQNSVEKAFGNYEAGRYGVMLQSPKKLAKIFPAIGKQSMLFDIEIPDELVLNTMA